MTFIDKMHACLESARKIHLVRRLVSLDKKPAVLQDLSEMLALRGTISC